MMVSVGENYKMLNNEPLMKTRTLCHSTLEGAQLQKQSTPQELQQEKDYIEIHEKLRATQVENNNLKIQLHEIQQKMKFREARHRQETLELNKNLISARWENEQLILKSLLMDEELRQSMEEGKELREHIGFLQQKLQPYDVLVKINHNIAIDEITGSYLVLPCSEPVDIHRDPVIAEVNPAVCAQNRKLLYSDVRKKGKQILDQNHLTTVINHTCSIVT
jgi:hypothetical protein